jgi:hypothetical protein
MRAASKRRCSRPAKSRRQLPVLIGIADLHVRCPCLHTQHANPNYANQPIPRSSFNLAPEVENIAMLSDPLLNGSLLQNEVELPVSRPKTQTLHCGIQDSREPQSERSGLNTCSRGKSNPASILSKVNGKG